MRIETDIKLDFKDVLIKPKRSTLESRADVTLSRTFTFPYGKTPFVGTPIIAANMAGVGTISMAERFQQIGCGFSVAFHKYYEVETLVDYYKKTKDVSSWYSLGIADQDFEKLAGVTQQVREVMPGFPFRICLDVANGYTQRFVDCLKKLRDLYPDAVILAGAVATPEMTEELILAGADIIKAGIGPGSACLTRVKTGIGYPQLSCVVECADAAHGLKGFLCSDGGCVVTGDICKAVGAGADFVMLGGMLSATDCSEEQIVKNGNGEDCIQFFGMSSETAQDRFSGGLKEYRASEGRTVLVPYRGSIDKIVQDILGGLRSGCTYVGAKTLKELPKRTTFIRVTQQVNPVFEKL